MRPGRLPASIQRVHGEEPCRQGFNVHMLWQSSSVSTATHLCPEGSNIFMEALRRESLSAHNCALCLEPVFADPLTSCCVKVLRNHVKPVEYVMMQVAGCNALRAEVAGMADKHVVVTDDDDIQRFLYLMALAQGVGTARTRLNRQMVAPSTGSPHLHRRSASSAAIVTRMVMPPACCHLHVCILVFAIDATRIQYS